jgi:hypothetical protein
MKIAKFFDKLEDHVRAWLSHHPFIYAMYGGVGVVLFWRGVWLLADVLAAHYLLTAPGGSVDIVISIWDAGSSFVLGSLILLSCGLFVSELIGKEIIISGLRGEKKLAAKTESEVRTETGALAEVLERLDRMENLLEIAAEEKIK